MKFTKSLWALCTGFLAVALLQISCNGSGDNTEIVQLKQETMAVHDEIMPQISVFDRNAVKIDSILLSIDSVSLESDSLHTNQVRAELTHLKSRIENATDQMMEWMMEFDSDPQDMTDEEIKAYYQSELEKVKNMKSLFDEVSQESADKLNQY